MKKRVLLITQYFSPDITAAAFRMKDLYTELIKSFDVVTITTYPQKNALDKIENKPNIYRINIKKIERKSFFNYIINYFGFVILSIFVAILKIKNKKFDFIIVSSPPLFIGISGIVLSKLFRSKLILDIRDIWPDSAVGAGMLKNNGMFYKLAKMLERRMYKNAYIITCVSKPMKDYINGEYEGKNIQVLYNGITDSIKNEIDTDIYQSKNNITRIVYAGNIGKAQNLGLLIEACNKLNKLGKQHIYEVIIIGDGVEKAYLEEKIRRLNLKNIIFMGPKKKEETVNFLNSADVLFLSLKPDPVFEMTVPSKLFDYLLNNKPILYGIEGEGKEILESLGCGIYFNANNVDSLVCAILEYFSKRDTLKDKARKNSEFVMRYFNRNNIFRQFIEEYLE